MPKTRKPRGAAAAAPNQAMALEKAKDKLSPEDQEKYASMLEDFDKQVEKKIKEIENEATAKADNFYRMCMMEIMKLPTSVRNLKWEDTAPHLMEPEEENEEQSTLPAVKSNEDKENDEIRQLRDEIAEMKETALKTTSKSKTAKRTRVPSTATRTSKGLTAAGAATPGGPGGVDESILTSTVNRTTAGKGGRGRRVLQTPGNISMVLGPPRTHSKVQNMTNMVPATPAAMAKTTEVRSIKPNEIGYSENWSPLAMPGTTTTTKGRGKKGKMAAAPVPDAKLEIGGGRELQIQVDKNNDTIPDLQLDPEALERIRNVRNELDKLLRCKN